MDIIKVSACGFDNELKQDILMGLTKAHKALQSKYLYDEQGSELFNQNCQCLILKIRQYYVLVLVSLTTQAH